jgi:hypothetical protein
MLITGRRRRRPRRGIIPQAKSAQQRLKHSSAPPSYCRVPCSSKVHRCEGHLATTEMKLVIFALFSFSSAECPSPDATVLRRRRQRSWHRPGHHDLISATHSERRRKQRPWHHDEVPTTNMERRCGQRP